MTYDSCIYKKIVSRYRIEAPTAHWGRIWDGCPILSRLRVLESVLSSFSGVRDGAEAENAFWHILKAIERSFLYLYVDILSSSNSVLCHIWDAKPRFGGNHSCPNVEPPLQLSSILMKIVVLLLLMMMMIIIIVIIIMKRWKRLSYHHVNNPELVDLILFDMQTGHHIVHVCYRTKYPVI